MTIFSASALSTAPRHLSGWASTTAPHPRGAASNIHTSSGSAAPLGVTTNPTPLTQGGQQTLDAPRLCCPPWCDPQPTPLIPRGAASNIHTSSGSAAPLGMTIFSGLNNGPSPSFRLGPINGPSPKGDSRHSTPPGSAVPLGVTIFSGWASTTALIPRGAASNTYAISGSAAPLGMTTISNWASTTAPHPKGSSIQHPHNLRLCCSPWDDHHFRLGLINGLSPKGDSRHSTPPGSAVPLGVTPNLRPSSQGEQHPTSTQYQALLLPLG